MRQFGQRLASVLSGGEVIELVGDVGAGKTTMVKGLAVGLGIDEDIQSPSFTISRVYDAHNDLRLVHYDFYRLESAGILGYELVEFQSDDSVITVIEWAGIVEADLPTDRLKLAIESSGESERRIEASAGGERSERILEVIK